MDSEHVQTFLKDMSGIYCCSDSCPDMPNKKLVLKFGHIIFVYGTDSVKRLSNFL